MNRLFIPTLPLVALLLFAVPSCQSTPDKPDSATVQVECSDGQSVDAEDGCNTCQCLEGTWQCTEMDCGQGDLFGPAKPLPQAPLQRECGNGDTKAHEDGCNTCVCRVGRWVCTLKQCLPKAAVPLPKPIAPLPKPLPHAEQPEPAPQGQN